MPKKSTEENPEEIEKSSEISTQEQLLEDDYSEEEIGLLNKGWSKDEIDLKRDGWHRHKIENDEGKIIGYKMVKPYIEHYAEVIFSEKSNPNDTIDVIISVDGECLIIQRGKKVVVPKRFLIAADHATHDVYRQMPDEPRKVLFKVQTYPYTVIREGMKEADYLALKKKGTVATKQT